MSGTSEPPGTSVLRAFAADKIAAEGLRATAREIGVRPYGLQYFVDGGKPRIPTLRKLESWYLRVVDVAGDAPADETASICFDVLLRDLPARHQAEALQRALVFYRELYRHFGAEAPLWLRRLNRHE